MPAIALCVLAFLACWWAGRRSIVQGLLVVGTVGYLYGILRANFPTTFSHFIFDAAIAGFYLTSPWKAPNPTVRANSTEIAYWVAALMLWPVVVGLIPIQPPLVTLVGLRGTILFLPMILVGARLSEQNMRGLAMGLAAINIVAVGFALAEYQMGLARFYPFNPVTFLIYRSVDGAGHFRIPATFANAHSFAGTMVVTIPLLLGCLLQEEVDKKRRLLLMLGLAGAFIGVLLASTRTNFVVAAAMISITVLTGRVGWTGRALLVLMALGAGNLILNTDRMSRYTQLNADTITERIGGSVNRSFLEILEQYPMGNGLGGGGTSIPYFLEGSVRQPIAIENEYGRILAELGVPGLLLWVAFLARFLFARTPFSRSAWKQSRRLYYFYLLLVFAMANLGTGLFTGIPGTALLLMFLGWIMVLPSAGTAGNVAHPTAAALRTNDFALHRATT